MTPTPSDRLTSNHPAVRNLSARTRASIPQGRAWGPDLVEALGHSVKRHTHDWQDAYRSKRLKEVEYIETIPGTTRVDKAVQRFDKEAGVFGPETDERSLMALVDDVLATGTWLPARDGAVQVVKEFPISVGVDSDGRPTNWVTAIVLPDGQFTTIYPSYRRGPNFKRVVEDHASGAVTGLGRG